MVLILKNSHREERVLADTAVPLLVEALVDTGVRCLVAQDTGCSPEARPTVSPAAELVLVVMAAPAPVVLTVGQQLQLRLRVTADHHPEVVTAEDHPLAEVTADHLPVGMAGQWAEGLVTRPRLAEDQKEDVVDESRRWHRWATRPWIIRDS